jgi:formamidopyrimidine-DNA glycosylase
VVVAHLGMSGRFVVDGDDEPHTHFRCRFDNGHEIRFIDPRTFGFVAVCDQDAPLPGVLRLGADAWTTPPEPSRLAAMLQKRTAAIKALLLDQALISGLGNIYADEALHRARIHPLRPGGDLTDGETKRLLDAISVVLESAIDNGGTSLDDLAYLLPDGRAGENLGRLRVYGRTDQPCLTCGTPIEQVRVRARSTHFCPNCQAAGK